MQRRPSMSSLRHSSPAAVVIDQEQRHAVAVMRLWIGFQINAQQRIARASAGRPQFLAVNRPALAVADGDGAHGADIGAGIRLGNRDRHADVAGEQFRNPAFDLFRRTFTHDIEPAENSAGKGHEKIGAGIGNFLGDDGHVDHRTTQSRQRFPETASQAARLRPRHRKAHTDRPVRGRAARHSPAAHAGPSACARCPAKVFCSSLKLKSIIPTLSGIFDF